MIWKDLNDGFHDKIEESENSKGYKEKWVGYYCEKGNCELAIGIIDYACYYTKYVLMLKVRNGLKWNCN